MSTDYELVCHKDNEKVSVCSDGLSGPVLCCDRSLSAFCITHRNCSLNIISEHDDDCDHYFEWSADNWKEHLKYTD